MTSQDPATTVDQVLAALGGLQVFAYSDYSTAIKSLLGVDVNDYSTSCNAQVYGETPAGDAGVVQRFKVETMAWGTLHTTEDGFSRTVLQNTLDQFMDDTSASLIIPIYRQYLEDCISAAGNSFSLLELIQDANFAAAFVVKVLDPAFIVDSMIQRYVSGSAQYVEAIAYIYERTRATLTTATTSLPSVQVFHDTVTNNSVLIANHQVDSFLWTALPFTWADESALSGPSFPTMGAVWASNWRNDSFATDVVNSLINIETPLDVQESGYWIEYGSALKDWINSQASGAYSDIFQKTDSIVDNLVWKSSYGCFAPGTLIATSAGARAIETLGVNDRVLTKAAQPQQYGVLSDEKVEHDVTPSLTKKGLVSIRLYGFNGEEPFVTAGHVFFTLAGPKAIHPEVARAENARIKVSTLGVGDVLLKLNSSCSGYDEVKITSINSGRTTEHTVHGLHFARGEHGGGRYHANGYWVAENYPEVTIKSLTDPFDKMSVTERSDVRQQILNMPKSLQKVSPLFGVLQDVFAKRSNSALMMERHDNLALKKGADGQDRLKAVEYAGRKMPSISSVTAHFVLLSTAGLKSSKSSFSTSKPDFAEQVRKINGSATFPALSISNGAVMVDGELAQYASISHMSVKWSHPTAEDPKIWRHGVLRSIFDGRALSGYVGKGKLEAASMHEMEVQHVMAASVSNTYVPTSSSVVFNTKATAIAASPPTPAFDCPFWSVAIGLSQGQGGGLAVTLTMPDLDAQWVAFAIANDNKPPIPALYIVQPYIFDKVNQIISIPVSLEAGLAKYMAGMIEAWPASNGTPGPAFNRFDVTLNLSLDIMHGDYTELQFTNGTAGDGPIHAIYCAGASPPAELKSSALTAIAKSQHRLEMAMNADVYNPSANIHRPSLAASDALASALFVGDDLSIADLQSTPAADDTDLNNYVQTYMQHAAIYWRSATEVAVFGNEQPAMRGYLNSDILNATQASQDFLGNWYSRGMIMQSLSRDQTYQSHFTAADQEAIKYYWLGKRDGCIAQDAIFNGLNTAAGGDAFLINTPSLQAYVNDSQDWAKLFYNFLNTDTQLNDQAFSMLVSGSTSNLTNRYCMILGALDTQNRQYDVSLWKSVRDKMLVQPASGDATDTTGDEFPAFATAFATQLIIMIQQGIGIDADLKDELDIDLQTLQEAYQTQDAATLAGFMFGASSDLGRCIVAAIKNIGGVLTTNGPAGLAKFFIAVNKAIQASPNSGFLSRVGPGVRSFAAVCVQGFAIYNSVRFMMNWNNLSDADKANAVVSLTVSVANLVVGVVDFIRTMRQADPDSMTFQIACVNWSNSTGAVAPRVTTEPTDPAVSPESILNEDQIAAVNSEIVAEAPTVEEQMSVVVKDSETVVPEMAQTFNLSEVVCSGLAVAANITTAVCMGFQIKADFVQGQPPGIKAMDIINEVTLAAQVITGGLEVGFTVFAVDCAALPIVGAVVAILGIVLTVVEMFVPRKPEPDLIDDYITANKPAYIASLPAKPPPLLTYTLDSTIALNAAPGKLAFTVRDPQGDSSTTLLKSLIITFTAGTDASNLFLVPTISLGSIALTTTLSYTFILGTGFTVVGGLNAAASTGTVVAKVVSTNTAGTCIGSTGLVIIIAGNVNKSAGTAGVTVWETTASRPDNLPLTDVYTNFQVTKQ